MLLLVAALWGSTGPFLRTGAAGLEELRHRSRLRQLLAEIRFLGLNYKVRPEMGASRDRSCVLLRSIPLFKLLNVPSV